MSSLIAKDSGNTRIPPLEAGTYPAICNSVIDIGLQYSKAFNKENHQVMFMFEIPSETIEIDGETKSRMISGTYTMSLSERSNLRKMLESWRSKAFTEEELNGFDLEKVLGLPCLVTIINETGKNGNSYSNISNVSKMPKGFPAPEGREEPFLFDMGGKDWMVMLPSLPEWIQNRIRESSTYKKLVGGAEEGTDEAPLPSDDDLPF